MESVIDGPYQVEIGEKGWLVDRDHYVLQDDPSYLHSIDGESYNDANVPIRPVIEWRDQDGLPIGDRVQFFVPEDARQVYAEASQLDQWPGDWEALGATLDPPCTCPDHEPSQQHLESCPWYEPPWRPCARCRSLEQACTHGPGELVGTALNGGEIGDPISVALIAQLNEAIDERRGQSRSEFDDMVARVIARNLRRELILTGTLRLTDEWMAIVPNVEKVCVEIVRDLGVTIRSDVARCETIITLDHPQPLPAAPPASGPGWRPLGGTDDDGLSIYRPITLYHPLTFPPIINPSTHITSINGV
jgi:hypothetical protein